MVRQRGADKRNCVMARKAQPKVENATGWRLVVREPLEAFDEHTDSMIELKLGQSDPSSIEGLIIDFRYFASDGEATRRSVLCWQCWRNRERIYVRGYCAFREELRTFRIDRMGDVVALEGGREVEVDDIRTYFAAFAADLTDEESEVLRLR